MTLLRRESFWPPSMCYKLLQLFRVTCFIASIYGLYFSHQYTNFTTYISSWYARALYTYWNYIFVFKLEQSSNLFSLKILALAGIWTRDLPGIKPICYQLSYPGLNYITRVYIKNWMLNIYVFTGRLFNIFGSHS